jgi:hypothetical protein
MLAQSRETAPRFPWYFTGSVVSSFGTLFQDTAQVVLAFSASINSAAQPTPAGVLPRAPAPARAAR